MRSTALILATASSIAAALGQSSSSAPPTSAQPTTPLSPSTLAQPTIVAVTAVSNPAPSATCATQVVSNPDFECGRLRPWVIPRGSVKGTVRPPGSNYGGSATGHYSLESHELYNNNLFTVQQNLTTCVGVGYRCSYDYYFESYYERTYRSGNTYVPYVHVYINYQASQGDTGAVSVHSLYPGQEGQWLRAEFEFTGSGVDALEFDLASPQRKSRGCNFARLDNVYCYAAE